MNYSECIENARQRIGNYCKACPECNGIGVKMEIDPDLIIPNKNLTLNEGAVTPWAKSNKKENYYHQMLEAVSKHFNFSMDTPFNELTNEQQDIILYGLSLIHI